MHTYTYIHTHTHTHTHTYTHMQDKIISQGALVDEAAAEDADVCGMQAEAGGSAAANVEATPAAESKGALDVVAVVGELAHILDEGAPRGAKSAGSPLFQDEDRQRLLLASGLGLNARRRLLDASMEEVRGYLGDHNEPSHSNNAKAFAAVLLHVQARAYGVKIEGLNPFGLKQTVLKKLCASRGIGACVTADRLQMISALVAYWLQAADSPAPGFDGSAPQEACKVFADKDGNTCQIHRKGARPCILSPEAWVCNVLSRNLTRALEDDGPLPHPAAPRNAAPTPAATGSPAPQPSSVSAPWSTGPRGAPGPHSQKCPQLCL